MPHNEAAVPKYRVGMIELLDVGITNPTLVASGALFVSGATGLCYKGSAGTHTIIAAA